MTTDQANGHQLSTLDKLLAGILAPFTGAQLIFKHRPLIPYAMPAIALGLVWGGLALVAASLPEGEVWWSKVLYFVLAGSLSAGIVFIQILIAIAAPFLDLLSEQTEEELGTLPYGGTFWQEVLSLQFWKKSLLAIVEALKLLILKLLIFAFAGIIGFIPVVGVYLAYPLSGIATGLDFLDYPLARRHWTIRAKVDLLKRHWPAFTGFGIIVFALLEIPGVGGVMLAPAAVGGTQLLYKISSIKPMSTKAS